MRELDDNGGVPHVLSELGVLYGLWSLEKHMGLLCKGKIKRRETEREEGEGNCRAALFMFERVSE